MAVTVEQFRNAIAEFADLDDPQIQSALDQAALWVDPLIWTPRDYEWGTIYLAAHFLSTMPKLSEQSSDDSESSLDNEFFVQSVSIGDRRITLAKRASSGSSSLDLIQGKLDSTTYGLLFLKLRRRNSALVAII